MSVNMPSTHLDLPMHHIRQAGGVRRFHTEPQLPAQTVAEHSWGVAVMAFRLWPDDVGLLQGCLTHDLGEIGCGDIPSPSKREWPALAQASDLVEDVTRRALGVHVELTNVQRARLKFLDRMELAWYAAEQRLCGNRYAGVVFHKVMHAILTMQQERTITLPDEAQTWINNLRTEMSQCD